MSGGTPAIGAAEYRRIMGLDQPGKPDQPEKAARAGRGLKSAGWTVDRGRHRCPACSGAWRARLDKEAKQLEKA